MKPVPEKPPATAAPRRGLQLIALILVIMALLAIYANVQRARRAQIETVTISPVASPTPSPSATP